MAGSDPAPPLLRGAGIGFKLPSVPRLPIRPPSWAGGWGWLALLLGWVAIMILNPVAEWNYGQPGLLVMIPALVLAQTGMVLAALRRDWPWRRVLAMLAAVLPATWLAEFIGVHTGLPFGRYQYTPMLQPQLGNVPLLIPAAWLMMLPPSWAIASRWVDPRRRWLHAVVSGLAFTAWDFYLDPQMVANGLWVWNQPGEYFGIPLLNMAGWWLVSSLITAAVAPREVPLRPLALIYSLTWLLELAGLGFIWGRPLAAFCGFLCMGIFAVGYWRKEWSGAAHSGS